MCIRDRYKGYPQIQIGSENTPDRKGTCEFKRYGRDAKIQRITARIRISEEENFRGARAVSWNHMRKKRYLGKCKYGFGKSDIAQRYMPERRDRDEPAKALENT